ncbi:MAG: hypothetical protein H6571_16975 [Lewinellaceae bacterium]|nr:hypothetical protein [Lewinellaceae bacterium]
MKRITIILILLSTIIILGCDPEFEFEFKGKIINKANNKPLEEVKMEYTLFPIENLFHWRSNGLGKELIKYTNKAGEFEIKFSTLTMTFDSLKIILNKEGFNEKILISEQDQWNSKFASNPRKFRFNFGKIYLEPNK